MAHATDYYLGCPVWACDQWRGNLFTQGAKREDFLSQYSAAFNTVEGNSVFYGMPSLDTVRRWTKSTCDGFQFVLKFPRAITHEGRLISVAGESREFLGILRVLAESDRLGPSLLQLPPDFGPPSIGVLERYLKRLPRDLPYAVEVRHHGFFDDGPNEQRLDGLLGEMEVDRVIFDSRPLFSAPPSDEYEVASQKRKPQTPIRTTATARRPMLRLVGRNDLTTVTPWIREWAEVAANWIAEGKQPFLFAHAPNDLHAPQFARMFRAELSRCLDRPTADPDWPGEKEALRQQLRLF